jgi:hypoxia up-regulated 1
VVSPIPVSTTTTMARSISSPRRPTSLLAVLLLGIFFFSQSAAAAVLGIDLGTEYIKAVLVKPSTPLEIVLSKDSKRKEPSIIAFKPPKGYKHMPAGQYPERFYGSAAQALAARIPGDVYPNLKQLLGQPWDQSIIVDEYKSRYPGLKLTMASPRKTSAFQSTSFEHAERAFSVEELLAMVLLNVKENAELAAGKAHKITGVVFTIPAYFTTQEKSSLELAADMAHLGVMSTITDGVAVGTHYATSRTFPDINEGGKPENHLVFDVGAGFTSATVLKMQGRTVKDVGRFNKTIQEVMSIGVGWDRTLGGDALNHMIVKDMAEQFAETADGKKLGKTAADLLAHPRAMARLWKDAERLRQVLSANQETGASFEELLGEIDFKYKLSRTRFEEMAEAAGFADRLEAPFFTALKQANLTVEDLNSVIMHGGATRTPFIIKRLEKLAGDASKLKSNVNADEAAAFGAAFKAARLSPSFRVKEVRDYDIAAYPTWMQYRRDGKDGKTQQQKIFSPTSFVGSSKTLKVPKYEDFELYLFQTRATDPGSPFEQTDPASTKIGSSYQSKRLSETIDTMKNKHGCKKENITTTVTVTLEQQYGLPELVSATVLCEVEPAEKKSMMDDVKGLFGFGKGNKDEGQQVLEDESSTVYSSMTDASESSSSTEKSETSTSTSATEKPKKSKDAVPKEDDKAKVDSHKVKIEFDSSHDESLIVPFAEQKFIRER